MIDYRIEATNKTKTFVFFCTDCSTEYGIEIIAQIEFDGKEIVSPWRERKRFSDFFERHVYCVDGQLDGPKMAGILSLWRGVNRSGFDTFFKKNEEISCVRAIFPQNRQSEGEYDT